MDTSGMASHDVTIACYKEWTGLSRQERRVEEEKALRHLASEKAASEESKSVDAKTDGNSLSVYPEEIDEGKGITMHEAKDDGNGKVECSVSFHVWRFDPARSLQRQGCDCAGCV